MRLIQPVLLTLAFGAAMSCGRGEPAETPKLSEDPVAQERRAIDALHALGWTPAETDNPHLGDHGHVVQLTLWGPPGVAVTDAWLRPLHDLPQLQALYLVRSEVTDQGLTHLAGLTELRDLGLERSTITDAGLKHIMRLPNLARVAVGETRVTKAGLRTLHEKRPDLMIVAEPEKWPGGDVLTIEQVKGQAQYRLMPGDSWQQPRTGIVLGPGAEIRTGMDSAVDLSDRKGWAARIDRLMHVTIVSSGSDETGPATDAEGWTLHFAHGRVMVRSDIDQVGEGPLIAEQ